MYTNILNLSTHTNTFLLTLAVKQQSSYEKSSCKSAIKRRKLSMMQLHQYSLCGRWCNVHELALAVCGIVTIYTNVIYGVRVEIITGNTGGWCA
jgi:hypothetical protein